MIYIEKMRLMKKKRMYKQDQNYINKQKENADE